jgi:hypothetical protein
MYTTNEIFFPVYAIAPLKEMRGPQWQTLIEHLLTLPEIHEETLAFMLMMVRLNGCLECENDSYRAMRGCVACAVQTIRRYKGSDEDLIALYREALRDTQSYLSKHALGATQNLK